MRQTFVLHAANHNVARGEQPRFMKQSIDQKYAGSRVPLLLPLSLLRRRLLRVCCRGDWVPASSSGCFRAAVGVLQNSPGALRRLGPSLQGTN